MACVKFFVEACVADNIQPETLFDRADTKLQRKVDVNVLKDVCKQSLVKLAAGI